MLSWSHYWKSKRICWMQTPRWNTFWTCIHNHRKNTKSFRWLLLLLFFFSHFRCVMLKNRPVRSFSFFYCFSFYFRRKRVFIVLHMMRQLVWGSNGRFQTNNPWAHWKRYADRLHFVVFRVFVRTSVWEFEYSNFKL